MVKFFVQSIMWGWVVLFVILILVITVVAIIFTRRPKPVPGGGTGTLPPPPPPDASAPGVCSFEGEDVFNKQIYDYKGTLVVPQTSVPCSNCNQYVFKDSDGCIPMGFDKNSGSGVCTAGAANSSGNWGIPISKKCPF